MFLTGNPYVHQIPFFFPLGFFFMLMAVFVIFRIICFRRCGRGCHYGRLDSQLTAEEILKRRFINHEIGEDEYLKMKEILKK
ncbi:hypothetical protein [Laceyella putida]|uniref:SHOCT domain-containing protein n=1 Tax=Laceyella putida TaxID=110101 RepID=A0ABW2RLQ8_9BACL